MQLGAASLVEMIMRSGCAEAPALIGADGELSYLDLGDRIARRSAELALSEPSLVVLTGGNSIDWVVTYLALLADGHVPLLAGDAGDALVEQWCPAMVVDTDRVVVRRTGSEPIELHPDLAVLMSTSGSTGSPKLIRLSHRNLLSNASSIAAFQRLGADDRGVTSLPLHYSLGLSVLHSHLVVGASVVVTGASVVDRCFRSAVCDHRVTNVAGVPHTFDLLEQAGPERVRVPSLRFLAQAGGRMHPEAVRRWADRAASWGVDWYTMYGQTEATARISYVPPSMAAAHPDAIGLPIPGGEMLLERVDGESGPGPGTDECFELVYRGPNVMMGYARTASDLARGHEVDELRTGDLARLDAESGLYRIVGRRARRVKPFGLRIDLDDVERRLGELGLDACVVGDDELLVAASARHRSGELASALALVTGLPPALCVALDVAPPRGPSGKIDGAALLAAGMAARSAREDRPAGERSHGDHQTRLTEAFATVLGRDDVGGSDSFVGLGGDSLNYVECSIRVEAILGGLPDDWHLRPIADLAGESTGRRWARVDTTVVLRAIAILAVVSTHMRLWHVPGGAHLLLGVAGFNMARFMLPIDSTRARVLAGLRTAARVAIPTVSWTLALMLLGQYTWHTLSLVNNYVGPRSHLGNHWHFWFIEVFVHLTVVTTVVMAVPPLGRLDRRLPYGFPLVLLGLTLLLRLDWADMGDWYNLRFRTHAVAWFFVLGWLVLRSSSIAQRLVTTALCLVTAPGVFQNPRREFFIAGGLVLLLWVREMPLPRRAVRPVATVASASMWILISHFVIWPPLKELFVVEVAYPLTVGASLGVWWLATTVPTVLGSRLRSWRRESAHARRLPFFVRPADTAVVPW